MKKPFDSKIVIITGASSGIGRAAALAFAAQGADVALVARRKDRLDALAKEVEALGQHALVLAADLTDAAAAERIVAATVDHFGKVDVLVNNAGVGMLAFVDAIDLPDVKRLFDLNFFGAVAATRAALPHLRKTRGAIVNVASVAGLAPMPLHAFYSASKYALVGFGQSMAYELDGGVRVLTVCPGPVETEFVANVQGATYPAWLLALGKTFMDRPETIATAITRAARRSRSGVIVPSVRSRLQIVLDWMGPVSRPAFSLFIRRMREATPPQTPEHTSLAA